MYQQSRTVRLRRFITAAFVFLATLVPAVRAQNVPNKVLIVYDGKEDTFNEGFVDARYLANLLGHFDLTADLHSVSSYRAGEVERYRALFFSGNVAGTVLPRAFVEDSKSTRRTVIWLGRHIRQLLTQTSDLERFGFWYLDYRDDEMFDTVNYRGVQLAKGDPDVNQIAVLNRDKVRVLATTTNGDTTYPYALQSDNFWYFADSPFSYAGEGDRYLVFADLLHDILGIEHAATRRAMVRLEDVSVDDDPEEIRALVDYLSSEGVPFQIALIPIFRDPSRGLEIYLSDRPKFVEVLRYAVSRGGSIVLHGVTHQHRGTSADDYEFWDDLADRPVRGESPERVRGKIQMALEECFRNGIYPVAWETPHNTAAAEVYRTLEEVFTVFQERTLTANRMGTEQYFPYPVRDQFGRLVVPENLGYLQPNDKADVILDHARAMLAVRDGIASFYFHPFLKLDLMKQVVSGMKAMGYEFISIRQFPCRVQFRDKLVQTFPGAGSVVLDGQYLRELRMDANGQVAHDDLSPGLLRGSIARTIAVGPGEWAVLEGLKERPSRVQLTAWERARDWLKARWLRPVAAVRRAPEPEQSQVLILWNDRARGPERNSQLSLHSLLETYGFRVRQSDVSKPLDLGPDLILVVPHAAAQQLSTRTIQQILRFVQSGGRLVLEGRSGLAETLAIRFLNRRLRVAYVTDSFDPERMFEWRPPEEVERFEAPAASRVLTYDMESRQPMALAHDYGAGHFLYLATLADSQTTLGVSRYPYLAEALREVFDLSPAIGRSQLELYFDPGFRQGVDLNRLANAWRKAGVSIVYVAAWHFYPRYTFDYHRFIETCHRNGIAVYAWFELPQVTKKFWEEHPEWREKSASGADGQVGWRYLMNLKNPEARRAALDFVRELLAAEDWDGVNLAELNFDAARDYLDPAKYVPMNHDVRFEFFQRAGFDPVELFTVRSRHYWKRSPRSLEQFAAYRVELITELTRAVLAELEPLRREKKMEVILTVLDSLHSPNVTPALGLDVREILPLMNEFNFTLQVEDPAEFWARLPNRYLEFAETYARLVPNRRRVMFDFNVMPDRVVSQTTLPSPVATGAEFAQLLRAASDLSGRAGIYSEFTVPVMDLAWAPAVLARGAEVWREGSAWRIRAPRTIRLAVGNEADEYFLDGKPWPCSSGGSVWIPPGDHRLTTSRPFHLLFDSTQIQLRLTQLTADLLSAASTRRGMLFEYESPGAAIALFNRQPRGILVDGEVLDVSLLYGQGEWSVRLPSGHHQVEVVSKGAADLILNWTSLLASSLIVGFGWASAALLISLYVFVVLGYGWRRLRLRYLGAPRHLR